MIKSITFDKEEVKDNLPEHIKAKITVKLKEVLNAPLASAWQRMCEKYRIDKWCMIEGLADDYRTVEITLEDAELYGLVEREKNEKLALPEPIVGWRSKQLTDFDVEEINEIVKDCKEKKENIQDLIRRLWEQDI